MRIEIAFSGESSRRPRCGYKLHRVKPGNPINIVCTSTGPTVINYHWHDGQPFIHTTPICMCTTQLLPKRERAYLGGLIARREEGKGWVWEAGVVELSAAALQEIDIVARDHRHLRGAKLTLKRQEAKTNSPLRVQLHTYEQEERLPPALDVMSFVHELWELFLPPVAVPQIIGNSDRVSWEDPGSEIPC